MHRPRHGVTEEIAAEIAHTRARLSQSLATLDREYALRQLFVQGNRLIRNGGSGEIGEKLREHPLPHALIALGATWLVLSDRNVGAGQALATVLAQLRRISERRGSADVAVAGVKGDDR
jgi:hypothetical protein